MSIFLSLCVWVSLYADVIVLLFSLSFFSSYFFFVLHICSVRVRIQPVRDEESGSGVISSAQVSGVFLFCEKGLKRESGRKRKKRKKNNDTVGFFEDNIEGKKEAILQAVVLVLYEKPVLISFVGGSFFFCRGGQFLLIGIHVVVKRFPLQ